jgi:hypothetical protein
MKLVATFLVAAFVLVSMSMAFADCTAHTKAQLAQGNTSQVGGDRQASQETLTAAPEQVVQQAKNVNGKVLEKK